MGSDVEQNFKEAMKWFKMAIENGSISPYYLMGLAYYNGQGVTIDYKQSFDYFSEAAERFGHRDAYVMLGKAYEIGLGAKQNYDMAKLMYEIAAKKEYVKAYMELGLMYQNINWNASNQEKAFFWLEKAAQENENKAQVRIAFMYKNGEGVEQNTMEATKWLKKAAEINPNGAKCNIGNICRITNDLGDMSDFLLDRSIESILIDMNKLDKNS
jgi:TPR repeat protein